jgi:antitoxin component of MazEF toxin-antitoxin module
VTSKDELRGVVAENGDLVVPSSELGELNLVPGQEVPVKVPPQATRRMRRDLYGVLAGKATPLTREEIKDVSREAWGDWIW